MGCYNSSGDRSDCSDNSDRCDRGDLSDSSDSSDSSNKSNRSEEKNVTKKIYTEICQNKKDIVTKIVTKITFRTQIIV